MDGKDSIEMMTNADTDFYIYMGKIFGSRIIQNITGDRFFDDNEKVWYLHFDTQKRADAYVSVKNNVIKNVYAKNACSLVCVLKELFSDVGISTVPEIYKSEFLQAGYEILDNTHKNFVKVRGKLS